MVVHGMLTRKFLRDLAAITVLGCGSGYAFQVLVRERDIEERRAALGPLQQ